MHSSGPPSSRLPSPFFSQASPTDNAVAVLQNVLHGLNAPVSPLAVEQAVYGHPDFPAISLYHLTRFLEDWGLSACAVRVAPESLPEVPFPAIAFLETAPRSCVMLHGCDGGKVTYLHPATGWVTEPVAAFAGRWKGVLVLVSLPADRVLPTIEPVPAPTQRAAIALTLVNAEQTLRSFIRYHLGIGFDHLFLFFDRPGDPGLRIAREYGEVTAIARDARLEERWQSCRLHPQLAGQLGQPEARQLLNVEVAVGLALDRKLDWLLQIDADELFYSPGQSVPAHFTDLANRQVYGVTYPNYEAVSRQLEVADYFREVTLFKKNPAHLTAAQRDALKRYAAASVNPGFLAYSNGKSAARLEEALLPWGNHHFQLRKGAVSYRKKYAAGPDALPLPASPVILHYAECGFSHFWQKYKTWGDFPDTFLGGQKIRDQVPFRIRAREVVKKGDRQLAEAFYRQEAMIEDPEVAARLVDEGLLCPITGPADMLKGS